MPIYDFHCQVCGPIRAMRPMAQSAQPCICPQCGALAPRSISSPAILRGYPARAAYADAGTGPQPAAAHPAGCGCCMRRSPALDSFAAAGGRVFT